jgi:hypothetical protein
MTVYRQPYVVVKNVSSCAVESKWPPSPMAAIFFTDCISTSARLRPSKWLRFGNSAKLSGSLLSAVQSGVSSTGRDRRSVSILKQSAFPSRYNRLFRMDEIQSIFNINSPRFASLDYVGIDTAFSRLVLVNVVNLRLEMPFPKRPSASQQHVPLGIPL